MISSEDAIYKTCGNRFIVDMYNSGGARNGFATWHNLNLLPRGIFTLYSELKKCARKTIVNIVVTCSPAPNRR